MKTLLNKIIEKLFGKKIPKLKYIEPYIEKDTECDKCEYLDECKKESIVVEYTRYEDTRSHYIVSLGNCCKKVCWAEIKHAKNLPEKEKSIIEL